MNRKMIRAATTMGICMFSAHALHAVDTYAPVDLTVDTSVPPTPLSVQIKGSQNITWDSNPLLLPTGEKSLFGSTTAPEFILTKKTPNSLFSLDTLVDENIYNRPTFDSTDLHEVLLFNQSIERWSAGLQAHADLDTTRTSELTTLGNNLGNVRHTGLSASPEVTFSPTSVDKFALDATALTARYNNPVFVDFNLFSVTPSYYHQFDPKNTGILSLQAQRYETAEGPRQTTDTLGPTLGWNSILTPALTVKLQAGFQKSQQTGSLNSSDDSNWNYIFSGDLGYSGERDAAHLIAARSQYPFENGTETLLTSFTATDVHTLNPYLSLSVAGSYQFAQDAPATGVNFTNETTGSIGLTYHLFENLDVASNYQYKNESLTNVSGTIQDNSVLFSLTFHPAARAL